MIKRIYIKCKTCECPITLRIAVLSNDKPKYTFTCPNCKMDITVGLEIKKLPELSELTSLPKDEALNILYNSTQFNCIDNCEINTEEKSLKLDDEKNIINLMGEIPYKKEEANSSTLFPIFSALKNFGTHTIVSKQDTIVHENWTNLKTAWKLSLKRNETLSKTYRKKYIFFSIKDEDFDLDSEIYDFSLFFIGNKNFSLLDEIFKCTPTIINRNEKNYYEYIKFCHNKFSKLEEKIIPIITSYMANYETFSPYMVILKNGFDLDINEYKIDSFNFEELKSFYGECFEVLADLYAIIAGLNNLLNNRKYDEFLEMDMNKYLIIDKANKSNCFKDNLKLNFLCFEYDSFIRNSSHHSGTRYDYDKNCIVLEAGKPLKEKEMNIEEYVYHSLLIFREVIEANMVLLFYNHAYELYTKRNLI